MKEFEQDIFDSKDYFQKTISNNSLDQLIQLNNQLVEQIKLHDHQIQSLVFQNYNKFICSIDTVRKMKTDIQGIDSQLDLLEKSMGRVAQVGVKLDDTFKQKRQGIIKLNKVNKDLQKLNSLCQLPELLAKQLAHFRSIQNKTSQRVNISASQLFNQSVQAYQNCSNLLTNFKQQPIIAKSYKQIIPKLQQIRTILWSILNFSGKTKFMFSIPQLRQITKKLLVLMDDPIIVLKAYIKLSKQKISEPPFQKLVLNNFSASGVINDHCKQYIQFTQLQQKKWHENKYFLNINYWEQLRKEITFFKSLQQKYQKKTYEKINNQFVEVIKDSHKQAINRVTIAVQDILIKYPYNFILGLFGLFNKMFPQLNQSFKEQNLYQQKVTSRLQTLYQIIQFKNQACKHNITQGKTAIFQFLNQLKQTFWKSVENQVLGCCLIAFNPSQLMKNSQSVVSQILKRLQKIIQDYIFFLQKPKQYITDEDIRIRLQTKLKRLQYNNLLQKLSTSKDSIFLRIVISQFLTLLKNTYLTKIYNSSIEIVETFGSIYDNSQLLNNFRQNKQIFFRINYQNIVKKIQQFYLQNLNDFMVMAGHQTIRSNSFQSFYQAMALLFPQDKLLIKNKPYFYNDSKQLQLLDTDVMLARKCMIFQNKGSSRSAILSNFIRFIAKTQIQLMKQQTDIKLFAEHLQICYELSSGLNLQEFIRALFHHALNRLHISYQQFKELMHQQKQ